MVKIKVSYSFSVFPEELDVLKHVGGELSDGAGPQLAAQLVRLAGDVLVEIKPVRQLKLQNQIICRS